MHKFEMLPILRIATKCNFSTQVKTTTQNEFKTIYKFPYIRGAGLVNRMKLYQTILTSIAVPTGTILNQVDLLSQDNLLFATILGLGGIVPLYGVGYFTNKLIGIVYFNENSDSVKFAYIDFWGRRKDVVVPTNELVPFSESPSSITDMLYFKVKQFSSKNTLKLCTRYGILDVSGFNKIFSS